MFILYSGIKVNLSLVSNSISLTTTLLQYISFHLYITTKIREIRYSHLSIISISLV
uniref:Uncharacterized protein n=1 Tax=Myoviridae sp. ct3wi9 TaxID=2826610 RepID=A0A8S5MWE9_9CAUD|nr:MAG TPA: hypothetical protein [Myoviridae sp. ct3wi9]